MDYLSREQTQQIRAILCVMVVFGHSVLGVLEITGPWAVAVFFFLSGFALALTSSRGNVDGRFIVRKFRNVVVPFALVAIAYHVIFHYYPVVIDYNSILGTIRAYLDFTPTVQAGWYIEMMLVLFAAFFIARKLSGSAKSDSTNASKLLIVLALLYLVVILYVLIFTTSYWTIMSAHCFIGGVAYYYYKDIIEARFHSIKSASTLGLLVVLVSIVCAILSDSVGTVLSNILLVISYTLAPVVVMYISSKIHLNSKILKFIGARSLWIYLVHVGIQYLITNAIFPGKNWPFIVFFLISFVSALIVGSAFKLIYDYTFGKAFKNH